MPSAATPWMPLAEGKLGTKEVAGSADNPEILEYYAESGHPEIEHDETAWCAAFVGAMLKRADYPNTGSLAARSYLNYGRELSKPEPGCIVVFWRGSPSSWQGHVAFYVGAAGDKVRVLGGNQGNGVSIAAYPRSQVLGYRMPIAPTVAALREAGSAEIKQADRLQKGALAAAVGTAAAEAIAPAPVVPPVVAAPPIVPKVDPALLNAVEQLSATQKLMEAARAVASLVNANRPALIVGGCLVLFVLGWWWKRRRVGKAADGQPVGVGAS